MFSWKRTSYPIWNWKRDDFCWKRRQTRMWRFIWKAESWSRVVSQQSHQQNTSCNTMTLSRLSATVFLHPVPCTFVHISFHLLVLRGRMGLALGFSTRMSVRSRVHVSARKWVGQPSRSPSEEHKLVATLMYVCMYFIWPQLQRDCVQLEIESRMKLWCWWPLVDKPFDAKMAPIVLKNLCFKHCERQV